MKTCPNCRTENDSDNTLCEKCSSSLINVKSENTTAEQYFENQEKLNLHNEHRRELSFKIYAIIHILLTIISIIVNWGFEAIIIFILSVISIILPYFHLKHPDIIFFLNHTDVYAISGDDVVIPDEHIKVIRIISYILFTINITLLVLSIFCFNTFIDLIL